MSKYLPVIAMTLLAASALAPALKAGGTGYPTYRVERLVPSKCRETPRCNEPLLYRHYEDRRRYNAAPCCDETVRSEPYLLKTIVVSKKRLPQYSYDSAGKRRCLRVLTVTYKELYSDGSCYVWTETV